VPGETTTHFARLAATPIEYLIRLERAVHQSSTWSSGTEYQAIRGKIIELCEACNKKLFEQAALFRRIYATDANNQEEQRLTDAEDLAVRALLRSTAGTFTVLHELLLFLPRESIRPELRDYCECLFRQEYDSAKLSLILTSLFNAFEYSLDDLMRFLQADVFKFKIPDPQGLSFGNVMELAIVDRSNPLAWAVLAHEFGHFLDHDVGITQYAVDEFAKAMGAPLPDELLKTLKRLCSEMLADLTGYYLQGPCSLLPLVNMSILVGCTQQLPIRFDGEHGAPTTRIEMIQELCRNDRIDISRIGSHLDALVTEERHKELRLSPEEQNERTLIHQVLIDFFRQVHPIIVAKLEQRKFDRFTAEHYQRSEALAERLAKGLPIGARRVHPEETAREQLVTANLGVDSREKYYLLEERAATVSEVITAGWIDRAARTAELFGEAFEQTTQEEVFSHLSRGLEDVDELLFKSINIIPLLEVRHAPTR
jgi:hypothetical protein